MDHHFIRDDDFVFERLSFCPINNPGCHSVFPDSLHLKDHSLTVLPEDKFGEGGGAVVLSALSVGITLEILHKSGEDIS